MFAKQRVRTGELRPSDIPVSIVKRRRLPSPLWISVLSHIAFIYLWQTLVWTTRRRYVDEQRCQRGIRPLRHVGAWVARVQTSREQADTEEKLCSSRSNFVQVTFTSGLVQLDILISLSSELTQSNSIEFLDSFPRIGFQEDLEKGKARHLFPAMFAKEKIKRGQLKEEEVPVRIGL